MSDHVPVTILTGFLGSGKTTLLNALLCDPAFADTAVIVNEFGDISIDHDLVQVGKKEMMVTTTGCLCCTIGSDIRSSLAELLDASRSGAVPSFSRVIVETTGLADPAPVINQIVPGGAPAMGLRDHGVGRTFTLAGVVCTIDIVTAEATIERYFEAMKQVAFADRIVLTKTDLARDPASLADIDLLRQRLRELNPSATLLDRNEGGFDLAGVFAPRSYAPHDVGPDVEGWLALEQALSAEAASGAAHANVARHGDGGILTSCLIADRPIGAKDLDAFFLVLKAAASIRLLRLKGLICLEDDPERPLVVHCVQHAVHPPNRLDAWPSDDRRTRIVAITHDIDPKALRQLFDAVTGEKKPLRVAPAAALAGIILAVALVGVGLVFTASSLAGAERPGVELPVNLSATHAP
ncbi:GTP-binding protein [Aurantimonas aggregata]|uniref:GTP-binding protein n=1 Tax=Aurantimonas aggregata TaxID=2047720 RepID=A0A6L9MC71_9HYPH|nr:GTP-binding protein [Aurantimonas aggregata]NDV85403.1 GTP-binding protein [Aurantimonas aggregata]